MARPGRGPDGGVGQPQRRRLPYRAAGRRDDVGVGRRRAGLDKRGERTGRRRRRHGPAEVVGRCGRGAGGARVGQQPGDRGASLPVHVVPGLGGPLVGQSLQARADDAVRVDRCVLAGQRRLQRVGGAHRTVRSDAASAASPAATEASSRASAPESGPRAAWWAAAVASSALASEAAVTGAAGGGLDPVVPEVDGVGEPERGCRRREQGLRVREVGHRAVRAAAATAAVAVGASASEPAVTASARSRVAAAALARSSVVGEDEADGPVVRHRPDPTCTPPARPAAPSAPPGRPPGHARGSALARPQGSHARGATPVRLPCPRRHLRTPTVSGDKRRRR